MPKIVGEFPYNGAKERAERLGLTPILDEVHKIITGFQLRLKEEKHANGGAELRKLLDKRFKDADEWLQGKNGEIDWTKCQILNGTRVCLGVEVQVSGRSDSGLVMDITHLRKAICDGEIDVGIIVVPSDRLGRFLTDRVASLTAARNHVKNLKFEDLPIILIALEHDGPGPALAKQPKK
jgi:hypothetical protein